MLKISCEIKKPPIDGGNFIKSYKLNAEGRE